MSDRADELDPGELLRRFRASYRNYPRQWRSAGGMPEGVQLATPAERPLATDDLPAGVRELLESHVPEGVELVKHLRIVDGEPRAVVDDESDLPPQNELVTVSHTVTLNSAEQLSVVTDVFVARRA